MRKRKKSRKTKRDSVCVCVKLSAKSSFKLADLYLNHRSLVTQVKKRQQIILESHRCNFTTFKQ